MVVCAVIYLLIVVCNAQLTYEGAQVYRIRPHTSEQLSMLQQLQQSLENEIRDDEERVDVWKSSDRVDESWEILVPAKYLSEFKQKMQHAHVQEELIIRNVADAIQQERDKNRSRVTRQAYADNVSFFKKFHRYEEIISWLELLAKKYPQYVRKKTIGKSVEGRDIILMKLSNRGVPGRRNKRRKQVIWMDGGIHAREWIAPAVVMYLMDRILKTERLLKVTDFYIVPLVNPDGYEYSHTNDRMWRKNRSQFRNMTACTGVDLNRNWDFKWMESGSSSYPCSQIYAGPRPESEPEVQALTRYISSMPYIDVYLTFHSFGQVWLSPWGYTRNSPPNDENLRDLALPAVKAAKKRYGKEFQYAQAGVFFPPASGAADDWVYNLYHVSYSYTIELRDTGVDGFFLKPEEIIPSGREMWAALTCLNARLYNSSYTCYT